MSSVDKTEYLEELRAGKHNTCFICGSKGHFARDCQNDENWRQEVDDGCWTFWYCDDCGKEFVEEDDYELHCCQTSDTLYASRNGSESGVSASYSEGRHRSPEEYDKFQHRQRFHATIQRIQQSSSRRNGFDGEYEDDSMIEHWTFDTFGENIQLQAVSCHICGEYIISNTLKGFTEGRLVVSEKNLHTTDDIVRRSMNNIDYLHDISRQLCCCSIIMHQDDVGVLVHDAGETFH